MTKGFKIIGIQVRTTNQNTQAEKDLMALWGQFYSDRVFDKIPGKVSSDIYAIYTDYKSNYNEDYTTIIGVPVATIDQVPDGLLGREFPDEHFQHFIAKGEMPKAVVDTWMHIWQNDQQLKRKYTYDLEIYKGQSQGDENTQVDIFIAVD